MNPTLSQRRWLRSQLPTAKGPSSSSTIAHLSYIAAYPKHVGKAEPEGKILRLTLDGKPAPGNPNVGKPGAATIPLIDPPHDTEAAKAAKVLSTYTFPGSNLTPGETWG